MANVRDYCGICCLPTSRRVRAKGCCKGMGLETKGVLTAGGRLGALAAAGLGGEQPASRQQFLPCTSVCSPA